MPDTTKAGSSVTPADRPYGGDSNEDIQNLSSPTNGRSMHSLPSLKRNHRQPRSELERLEDEKKRIWSQVKESYFKPKAVDFESEALNKRIKKGLQSLQSECLAETEQTKFHLDKIHQDLTRLEFK